MHHPTQYPYDILAYELLLEAVHQKQPTTAKNNKAVVRQGSLNKFRPFSEGFRRCHKSDLGPKLMISGNHHTILLPVFHNQRNWGEKEDPTRTIKLYKDSMSRLRDQTLY
jgi:hypothetical protein